MRVQNRDSINEGASLDKITKATIVEQLKEKHELSHRQAREYVDSFFDEIIEAVATGEVVKLKNVIQLTGYKKAPRKTSPNAIGGISEIPEQYTIKSTFSQNLRGALNDQF